MAEAVQLTEGEGPQIQARNPGWFKPGQSGNPGGIPVGGYPSLRKAARRFYQSNPDELEDVIRHANELATDREKPWLAVPAANFLGKLLGDFDVTVVDNAETQQKRLVVIKRAPDGTETVVEPQNGNGHTKAEEKNGA